MDTVPRRLWGSRKKSAEPEVPRPPPPAAFPGHTPTGRPEELAREAVDPLDGRWERTSHYDRRAEVTAVEALTTTGTVRISCRVTDDQPFAFSPGQFVGVEADLPRLGRRHSPYCMMAPPSTERTFRLLVRVVAQAPLSGHLASLRAGDEIAFRGPIGRSMLPKDATGELVLLATGVGISPYLSLLCHLLGGGGTVGGSPRIRLWWGLRLAADICLTDELDDLARAHPAFTYAISLSSPHEGWDGLVGRLSESAPPLLATLGDKRFYLSGNGAMVAEMAAALSDLGVDRHAMHTEPFFDARHEPDPDTVARIRERFVANDLFSPYTHQQLGGFDPLGRHPGSPTP